jgi:hypothetical protein
VGVGTVSVKVFIYVREQPLIYQDAVVVLAEGLQQLGATILGNTRYWRRSTRPDDWLIESTARTPPADTDVVVVTDTWIKAIDHTFRVFEQPLPAGLFAPGRRYRTVYLDLADGYDTAAWRPEFAAFDVILRAKFNRRCHHPANHRPWVLGLNSRILQATAPVRPWEERRSSVLINFGASHPYPHGARTLMTPLLIAAAGARWAVDDRRDDLSVPPEDPEERLAWEQTQHRHRRTYYERLRASQAVAAFCGELIPPAPWRPTYLAGGRRARWRRWVYERLSSFDPRPPRLIQWDSWRFWEGLAAGCLVFQLDLPHYGVELPVMPRHLEHYVALRPENMRAVMQELARDPARAGEIAARGRAWALEHYSPRALAARFLATLERVA